MNFHPSNKKNTDIDYIEIILKYLRYWKLFLLSFFFFVSMTVLYLKLTEKVYEVKANILVKEDKGNVGSSGLDKMMAGLGSGFSIGSSTVDNELLIVKSHTVLRQVAKNLGLNIGYTSYKYGIKKTTQYDQSPLKLTVSSAVADTLSVGMQFKVKAKADKASITYYIKGKKAGSVKTGFPAIVTTPYGNFTISPTGYYTPEEGCNMTIDLINYDICAEDIEKAVKISIVSKKADAIGLLVKDTNVKRAKDILNMIIQVYNADGLNEKNLIAENTAKFLEERIDIISKELVAAELGIEKYKKQNKLTHIETEAGLTLTVNQRYEQQLVGVRTELAAIGLIESFLTNPANQYSLIPYVSGNSVDVVEEYNKLILERMSLLSASDLSNPQIRILDSQIDAVRETVIRTLQNTKEGMMITINKLKEQENIYKDRIKNMPQQEREFLEIKRQQMIKEELFVFLLKRNEENAITLAITTPGSKIIDAAYAQSKPVAPKTLFCLLFAAVFSCVPVIGFVFLKDKLRIRFSNRKELEEITDANILGEICSSDVNKALVVEKNNTSSINELFRLMRNNLEFMLSGQDKKVVLITSTESGEGKTFVACNLAVTLALTGKKVVVVGLDIRKPRLTDYLSLPKNNQGVTGYIVDTTLQPADIKRQQIGYENLDIIVSGPVPPNPSELILSKRLDELFAYLRTQYDYVIVDSAPMGLVGDSFSLNRIADTTLYVCRANKTTRKCMAFFNTLVENNRIVNPALILNDVKLSEYKGYGYGYGEKSSKK